MSIVKAISLLRFILPLVCLLSEAASAAQLLVSIDDRNGMPVVSRGGAPVISSGLTFWGKNWLWAGPATEFIVLAPFDYEIHANTVEYGPPLNIDLTARVKRPTSQRLTWDFDLNARNTSAGVIGGGLTFGFDLENLGAELGEPELLPGNRGWSWGHPGATRLEMHFEPPMASVYFERGRKSEIRAFFYAGDVPQGQRHYVVSLDISSDVAIGPTTAERFGVDDPAKWPKEIVDWNRSPIDLSFLNDAEKPAGKHGFVRAVKGRLEFEDGAPARFWGTNLTGYALFNTPRNAVKLQAHRLSELGFNLVRLVHHDSSWVVPNVLGDHSAPNTGILNEAMMEKLDWWIKCLQDEGIYVWLDLHVGWQLKAADAIDDFDEIAKGKPTGDPKGYNYVNPSIQKAMQQFNEAYVDHRNVFTGLRYREEPAIAAMLLTNENDLTHHYGNALLPDKNVPKHNALYMSKANAFAAKYALPNEKTWRSWEHGPSKLFLNDLEHQFDIEMTDQLRALGVKVPIVTTSAWGSSPLSSLPALTTGDIIDAHSYGGTDELAKNPLYMPNLIDWIATAHVAGRPLTSTEWNVESFPAPDRHAIPLYVAGSARLQGWDALMLYAYSQAPFTSVGRPGNWEAFNDPALLATLPAAALLYRRHDVQEARTNYVFAPTPAQLFNRPISPVTSVALRTAIEKGKLTIAMPRTPELPWLEESQVPAGAKVMTDPNLSVIDENAREAVSDTGELQRNWDQGVYRIDTPRTQAATGWIGGKEIALADVEIAATTRNATIAVQSLDGRAISEAHVILISLGARSVPEAGSRMPFHSEPVRGRLRIRALPGLSLHRQGGTGSNDQTIASRYENGRYEIDMDHDGIDHWLVLK